MFARFYGKWQEDRERILKWMMEHFLGKNLLNLSFNKTSIYQVDLIFSCKVQSVPIYFWSQIKHSIWTVHIFLKSFERAKVKCSNYLEIELSILLSAIFQNENSIKSWMNLPSWRIYKLSSEPERRRYKKRCWRQALSFLSDNPRHHHYKEKEDARDCSHKSGNIFVKNIFNNSALHIPYLLQLLKIKFAL